MFTKIHEKPQSAMSDDKPLRVYALAQIKQSASAEFSYETAISIAGVSNAIAFLIQSKCNYSQAYTNSL
ncbi:hypothetical protein AMR41_27440 [Hapalosiphon sp. MRB220]|nr:hypothetical protein AMR41_27440 [Hapalosiphon sp. MRB220]